MSEWLARERSRGKPNPSTNSNGWYIAGNSAGTFTVTMPSAGTISVQGTAPDRQDFLTYQKNVCLKARVTYTLTTNWTITNNTSNVASYARLRIWHDGSNNNQGANVANVELGNTTTSGNKSGSGSLVYTPTTTDTYILCLQVSNYIPPNQGTAGTIDVVTFSNVSVACQTEPGVPWP